MTVYSIRHYGKDHPCRSLDALRTALEQDYRGRHVSILYNRPTGITGIQYVSVDRTGVVRRTYGNHELFDYSILANIRDF